MVVDFLCLETPFSEIHQQLDVSAQVPYNMKACVVLTGCLNVFVTLVDGASIPTYFERFPSTPRQLSVVQVQRELGARLSNTTAIFGPDDSQYKEALSRWNSFVTPKVQLVIEPGQESDVSTIVSLHSPSWYLILSQFMH